MINPITNINSYIKRLDLKQKSTARTDSFGTSSFVTQHGVMMNNFVNGNRINSIRSKMKSGKRLTATELSYLKQHDPDLHSKATRIAEERTTLEQRLKRCKSKREVESVRAAAAATSCPTLASINGMSSGEAASQAEFGLMRSMSSTDQYSEFTNTLSYKKLPLERRDKLSKSGKPIPKQGYGKI